MSIGKSLFFTAMTLLSFIIFQSNISASDQAGLDTLTQDTMAISKDDIVKSLEMLKSDGKISEEDFQKTKKELLGMSDTKVDELKKTAEGIIRNDPDKALDLINKPTIDVKAFEELALKVKK